MEKQPIVFKSTHRAKFSEIDLHGHMNNEHYLSYFMDHRFIGLRENLGWDLVTIAKLPVLFVVNNVNISYLKPVKADQAFQISSHVEIFNESTCTISCTMGDEKNIYSKCEMKLTCIDQKSRQVSEWPKELISKFYQGVSDA